MRPIVPDGARLLLRVDATARRGFLPHLVERLEKAGYRVAVSDSDGRDGATFPRALEALLELERHVLARGRPWLAGPLAAPQDRRTPSDGADEAAGAVIDLRSMEAGTDEALSGEKPYLAARFDGAPGMLGAARCLLAGRSPRISVSRHPQEAPAAVGVASLEAAGSTGEAMVAVWSRLATLLLAALGGGRPLEPFEAGLQPPLAEAPSAQVGMATCASRGFREVADFAVRSIYRLACHAPHWRIGWRFTERGVWETGDLAGAEWRILADPGDRFYADPFPVRRDGRHAIFFEDFDHRTGKGIISCAEIGADGRSGPVRLAIEEPWHLSYPFLIEADGHLYMIPESSAAGDVPLYRCVDFPTRWERVATLLSGIEAADATVLCHGGRWFMFSVVRDGLGGYSDTLAIHHAPGLFGPWQAHPANPVLVDPSSARPAGAMVVRDGLLRRPVQDCREGYGKALGLATVTRLDETGFEQRVDRIIRPNAPQWPGRKLHTLNHAAGLETIDGSVIRPKAGPLADLVERRTRPKNA